MNSMTGYGRGEAESDAVRLTVEATTFNKRNLEVSWSGPKDWVVVDSIIQKRVRERFSRGKVHLALQVETEAGASGLDWDVDAVKEAFERWKQLRKSLGVRSFNNAQVAFELAMAQRKDARLPDVQTVEAPLLEAIDSALEAVAEMRQREGRALAHDLRGRVQLLQAHLHAMRDESTRAVPNYREALMERLKSAEIELDLNDERLLKELALFADRTDVTEELTRLDSHLTQVVELLNEGGVIGRRLDFLAQEIHRELNTIGSKTTVLDVTRFVIESKNELERFREQVQNIE